MKGNIGAVLWGIELTEDEYNLVLKEFPRLEDNPKIKCGIERERIHVLVLDEIDRVFAFPEYNIQYVSGGSVSFDMEGTRVSLAQAIALSDFQKKFKINKQPKYHLIGCYN